MRTNQQVIRPIPKFIDNKLIFEKRKELTVE